MNDTDNFKSELLENWDSWELALDLLEAADKFIIWNATQERSLLKSSAVSAWNFKQAFTIPEAIPNASLNALPVQNPNYFPTPSAPSSTRRTPASPPPSLPSSHQSSPASPPPPSFSSTSSSTRASPDSPPPLLSLSKQSSFRNERRFENQAISEDNYGSSNNSGSSRSSRTSNPLPSYETLPSTPSEPSPTSPKSTTYISPNVSESYLYPQIVPAEIIVLYHMAHRVATQCIGTTQKLTPLIASSLADRALQQARLNAWFFPRPELAILLPRLFDLLADDNAADENAAEIPDSAKTFAAITDEEWKSRYGDTAGVVGRVKRRIMRARREGRAWLQLLVAFIVLLPVFWDIFVKLFPREEAWGIEMD